MAGKARAWEEVDEEVIAQKGYPQCAERLPEYPGGELGRAWAIAWRTVFSHGA